VIPTPQQLEQLAAATEGKLEEAPFASVLLAFASHRQTAILEIRRRQVWKRVFLEHGVPVDCRSNLAHETLGRYMVLEGKLSEDDFTSSLSQSASSGVPLGEVLLAGGMVSAVELFKILQQNLAKKLLDLFTWNEGEFRRLDDPFASESALKVRPAQLIFTGVTRFAPQEEVDMAVWPLVGRLLAVHPSPPFPLEELRLSPKQAGIVESLRQGTRLRELAEATGLPFGDITRLLYALSILQVVVPAEDLPKGSAGTAALRVPAASSPGAGPPHQVPAASSPAAPPATLAPTPMPETVPLQVPAVSSGQAPAPSGATSAGEVERRRNQVMEAYLSYKRQDAFDLLGVPEEASPGQIEIKFLDFAHRFAPWSLVGHPELAAIEERARDLFLAGARAYAELADTASRSTLLFRRKTLREERSRKTTASFAIKTDLLDAEAQHKKGKALMEAGKHKDAVMLLEFASDCDPQNSLYATELAYCRFLLSSANHPKALRELKEVLRRDPACGLAAYYAGEIHLALGNRADAEASLRQASKLMHPDRRPLDALRLLAGDKKR
jgi:hypothetical protein